jgi:hypothetical protein
MSVVKSYQIKKYQVHFYRPFHMTWFGVTAEIICIVECYEDEVGAWGDGSYLCRAYFLTEDSEVPNSFHQPENYAGGLFLRAKELGPFIDILRNEKPVSVYLNSEHPEYNQFFTGLEPVGEEERKAMFFIR